MAMTLIFYLARLFFAVHLWLPLVFYFSPVRKKYANPKYLATKELKSHFFKNLLSTYIFIHWFGRFYDKRLSLRNIFNAFYFPLFWTLQDAATENNENYNEQLKEIKSDILLTIVDKNTFETLVGKVLVAQKNSMQQLSGDLSMAELACITAEKAGYSFLLFASMVNTQLSEDSKQTLYNFGEVLQLADDALDVYDDSAESITTLANSLSLAQFEAYYHEKTQILLSQIKTKELLAITIVCVAIGYVQIDNLKKLPHQVYLNFPRKQLICDMQKFKFIKAFVKVVYREYKSYSKTLFALK